MRQSNLDWLGGRKGELKRKRIHTLKTSFALLICLLELDLCEISRVSERKVACTEFAIGDEFALAGGDDSFRFAVVMRLLVLYAVRREAEYSGCAVFAIYCRR